jgi:hypothetical protein
VRNCSLDLSILNRRIILITVSSLRFVHDNELRLIGVEIITELERIWKYYNTKRNKTVYPEACATIIDEGEFV